MLHYFHNSEEESLAFSNCFQIKQKRDFVQMNEFHFQEPKLREQNYTGSNLVDKYMEKI